MQEYFTVSLFSCFIHQAAFDWNADRVENIQTLNTTEDIGVSSEKLKIEYLTSRCKQSHSQVFSTPCFNYTLNSRQRKNKPTFSQVPRSYATNFGAEVNNTFHWSNKFIINNISPSINLPLHGIALEISDITKGGGRMK